MLDSRDINELHPTVKRQALELTRRMELAGYPMGISSTYRDFEYQNYLYSLGRTKSGNIVTNAKASESFHNYRLAFDIFKNVEGHAYDDMEFFNLAGKLGQELELIWGGSWTGFVDKPHFQWSNGLGLKDLQNGKYPPDIKLSWELNESFENENIIKIKKPEEIIINFNGEDFNISAVNIEDFNYILLRDMEKLGFNVFYDEQTKKPFLVK